MKESELTGSRPSPYCGRVDEHPPHEHHTHEEKPWQQTPLVCPGGPVTQEGGATS